MKMMPARAQSEELAIEHVRKPRQRLPVEAIDGKECTDQTGARQPRSHPGVFVNVGVVVEVNERVPHDRAEHHETCDD